MSETAAHYQLTLDALPTGDDVHFVVCRWLLSLYPKLFLLTIVVVFRTFFQLLISTTALLGFSLIMRDNRQKDINDYHHTHSFSIFHKFNN